ncbi:hypothetical protein [Pedobacter miscanthi]|uniref:PNPLA domain-containing protein n=1 Tax=Pedobacter miscanthi TaxID=2259170 RepID=A0A366L218_9SPHI|nr:hypothetical protein [Pedobacter miscanthi]RBQ07928.1 hypothetical protein DRW42_10045 [Pedobacter miscanthi]
MISKIRFFLTYLLLAGLLVTGSMTMKNSFLLFSDHAHWGMTSFQLASTDSLQKTILTEWDRQNNYAFERDYGADIVKGENICGPEMAKRQIQSDFFFIFFYVAAGIMLFNRYVKDRPLYRATKMADSNPENKDHHAVSQEKALRYFLSKREFVYLITALVIAAIFDVLENHYLLKSIERFNQGLPGEAFLASSMAKAKFLLLILVFLYFAFRINLLKRLSYWLSGLSTGFMNLLVITWQFRIVVILQLIFFALVNLSDQGQDLMVTINTSTPGTILLLTSVCILAAMNWYLPKLYIKAPEKVNLVVQKGTSFDKDEEKTPLDYARLLGILTFFIPALAMLKTMQLYHIPYFLDDIPAMLLLLVSIWLSVWIIRRRKIERFYIRNGEFLIARYWISILMMISLCGAFYFIQLINGFGKLSFLCMDLFLLGSGFLITVTLRDKLEKRYNFNMARLSVIAGLIAALFFILFNLDFIIIPLTALNRFFTLNIVIWALIGYALLFSFLLALSNRWRIQLITILLVCAAIGSAKWISSFHEVEVSASESAPRDSLNEYVRCWLDSRRDEIEQFAKNNPDSMGYPVYFVNSYGGGIRAAAWATMVISRLNQKINSAELHSGAQFTHHVFSYSGASGGTVGFSLLCAFQNKPELAVQMLNPNCVKEVFRKDYLTGNIVGIFGRDIPMSVLGTDFYDDRARLQEKILGYSLNKNYQIDYDIPLSRLYPSQKTDIPLLFSNTFDINTAHKGITAPVLLNKDDFPAVIFIQDLLKGKDIPLSAAAFLSARFPYVSPTGKFDQEHHFMDGGTIENSGGQTSLQIIRVFERVCKEKAYSNLKLSINLLSLSNSVKSIDAPKPAKNLYELLGPVQGLLNTIGGNGNAADSTNAAVARQQGWNYRPFSPTEVKIDRSWPVLPLGWQISDDALEEMKRSIESREQDSLLNMVLGKLWKSDNKGN